MAIAMAIWVFLATNWFCLLCDKAGGRVVDEEPLLRALCSSCSQDSIPGGAGAFLTKWDPSWWSWSVKSIEYFELHNNGEEEFHNKQWVNTWKRKDIVNGACFINLRLWHLTYSSCDSLNKFSYTIPCREEKSDGVVCECFNMRRLRLPSWLRLLVRTVNATTSSLFKQRAHILQSAKSTGHELMSMVVVSKCFYSNILFPLLGIQVLLFCG